MGCMRVDIPAMEPPLGEKLNEALRKWLDEALDGRLRESFRGWLHNGYTDFSRFPEWIWMFEVKGGALDECLGATEFRYKDGSRTVYCREAFVRFVEDNNQYMGIFYMKARIKARKDAKGERHDKCEYDFRIQAVLPRFMGILHHEEGYVLFYFMDGRVYGAWLAPFIDATVVKKFVRVINNSTPFFVLRHRFYNINNIVFSAIPRVDMEELDKSVKRELVKQINDVGVKRLFLRTRNV